MGNDTSSNNNGKITIGYWGIKYKGEHPKFTALVAGLDFNEESITDPNEWFGNKKDKLGFKFPNLPYILDGDH